MQLESANVTNILSSEKMHDLPDATNEDKALPSQQFNAAYAGVTIPPIPFNGVVYYPVLDAGKDRLTVDDLDRKRYSGSVVFDYESEIVDLKFFIYEY